MGATFNEADAWRRIAMKLGDAMRDSDVTPVACKFCGSTDIVKNGHRKGTQYYICKHCGHGFVNNAAVPGSRYPKDVVSRALYNYYAGMSLNAVAEGIKQETNEKLAPSDSSIYKWLAKYTRIALDEAAKSKPTVGDRWVMDETVITLDGRKYWLCTALDEQTRYLLGIKLSTNRAAKDIQALLEAATAKTGTIPREVLTDGWGGYRDAIERAYGADSKHIVSKPFAEKDLSTNLMERWNGTLKDRLRPMRGMDRNRNMQLILEGFVFFYNYLRPHSALDGKTPAEAATAEYPFDTWGDVVGSQEPHIKVPKLPKGMVFKYRVRNKPRPKRRTQREHGTLPSLGGMRS